MAKEKGVEKDAKKNPQSGRRSAAGDCDFPEPSPEAQHRPADLCEHCLALSACADSASASGSHPPGEQAEDVGKQLGMKARISREASDTDSSTTNKGDNWEREAWLSLQSRTMWTHL